MVKDEKPKIYKIIVTPNGTAVRIAASKGDKLELPPNANLTIETSYGLTDYVPKARHEDALSQKGRVIREQQQKIRESEIRERDLTAANLDLEKRLGEATEALEGIQKTHEGEINRLLTDAEMTAIKCRNLGEDVVAFQREVDGLTATAQQIYIKLEQMGAQGLVPLQEMIKANTPKTTVLAVDGNLTMPGSSAYPEPVTPITPAVPEIKAPGGIENVVNAKPGPDAASNTAQPAAEIKQRKESNGDQLRNVYYAFAYLVHEYFCKVFSTRGEKEDMQKKRAAQYYDGLLEAYAAGNDSFQPIAIGKAVAGADLKILGTVIKCGERAYEDKGDAAKSAFFGGIFFPNVYSRLLQVGTEILGEYQTAYGELSARLKGGKFDITDEFKEKMSQFFRDQRTKYETVK